MASMSKAIVVQAKIIDLIGCGLVTQIEGRHGDFMGICFGFMEMWGKLYQVNVFSPSPKTGAIKRQRQRDGR